MHSDGSRCVANHSNSPTRQGPATGYCASCLQGGGIYHQGGKLELSSTTLWDNTGQYGGGCALHVTATASSESTLFNTTFLSGGASCGSGVMVKIENSMRFTCALGTYMTQPPLEVEDGVEFTGCMHSCPAGTYGNATDLADADCSGACFSGHYCPAGTGTPIACPVGTYLPVTGGGSETACLPCIPGTPSDAQGRLGAQ